MKYYIRNKVGTPTKVTKYPGADFILLFYFFTLKYFITGKAAYILVFITRLLSLLEQLMGIPIPHTAFSPSGYSFSTSNEIFCHALREYKLRTDQRLGKDIGC